MPSSTPSPLWTRLGWILFILPSFLWGASELPLDAYLLGMGGAGAAVVGGSHAVFLNPAGTSRTSAPILEGGILVAHDGGLGLNSGLVYPFPDGTVFSLTQSAELPSNLGSSTVVAGSVGLPLNSSRDFLIGMNLKQIFRSKDLGGGSLEGRGFGLDLGLAYDLRKPQGTLASFSLSLLDLASQLRYSNNQEISLSRHVVLGAAFLGIPETRLEVDYDWNDRSDPTQSEEDRLRIGGERFFADRFFSLRAGIDGALNSDPRLALGAGYHPDQPFEVCYAFQAALDKEDMRHSFSFAWRFEESGPGEGSSTPRVEGPSPVIDLALVPKVVPQGRPVSPLPLSKVTIKVDPPFLGPIGAKTSVTLSFPEGAPSSTAQWRLSILPEEGPAIKVVEGKGALPASLTWDGRSGAGKPAGTGSYRFALKTFDGDGRSLSDDEASLQVLSARPRFALKTQDPFLAPKSGSRRREARWTVEPDGPWEVTDWTFEVDQASDGKEVHRQKGTGGLPRSLRWAGRGPQGPLGDGLYLARLTANDKAGNHLRTDAVRLYLDSTPPRLGMIPSEALVDPSFSTGLKLSLSSEDLSGLRDWKVEFRGGGGSLLGTLEGRGNVPKEVRWDGRTPAGTTVEPGTFLQVVLQAQDNAGNRTVTPPSSIQVDFKPKSEGGQMVLNLATIRFPEKASVMDDAARRQLAGTANSLKQYLEKSVLVVKGYASEGEGDPVELSHRRAEEVQDFLVKTLGVPTASIHALGYGVPKRASGGQTPETGEGQRKAVLSLYTLP